MPEFQHKRNGLPRINQRTRVLSSEKTGGLVVYSPQGKEITIPPERALKMLADQMESLSNKNSLTTVSDVGVDAERVNKAQSDNVFSLMDAALATAKSLNPHFNDAGRTMEDRLQDAVRVIVVATEANVVFEKNTLEASIYNFQQNMLTTFNAALANGILSNNSRFAPEDRKMFLQLLARGLDLMYTRAASEMTPEQVEIGTANAIKIAQARADSGEARERAKINTELERQKLEARKQELKDLAENAKNERENKKRTDQANADDLNRKSVVETQALAKQKAEELALAQRENSLRLNREGWGALVSNIKRLPSDGLNGIVNLIFDSNDGLFVRGAQAFTSTINHLSENVATTRIIGLGAGGTVGLLGGLSLGSAALSYVEAAAIVSPTVLTATIWVSGVSLGVSGAALGAYLGPNIVRGIRNVYDFGSNATKDIIDAADNWIKDPSRRWNKNKQVNTATPAPTNTNLQNPPQGGPNTTP